MCEEEREELWLEGGGVRFVYTDDYVDSILAKVAELEAKLEKYQNPDPIAYQSKIYGTFSRSHYGDPESYIPLYTLGEIK